MMKSLLLLIAVVGLAAGLRVTPSRDGPRTTERTVQTGWNRLPEKDELSPVNAADPDSGLIEVSEEDIPEDALVYVWEEPLQPRQGGESLSTADNIVFRPLFQYRNKQAALARRRNSNGYRRRYFVQRRPYRNAYPQYYYQPYNTYKWG